MKKQESKVKKNDKKKSDPKKNGKKDPALTKKQLDHYRELLMSIKLKIMKDISDIEDQNLNSHKETAGDLSGYSLHMADVGTDNFDRELALDVVGNEQNILYEIDKALVRIEKGMYGICEIYNTPIPLKRLDAIPWTPYCKEAAEKIESQSRGRIRG